VAAVKIHPLFKWFGSKWQSAKHYPEPRWNTIVEPYAGSAGYALNYCDRNVLIWEDDPNLMQLWLWLIEDATQSNVLDIPVGLPVGTDILSLGLSLGQALLLKHWQRTNNAGDCWTISPWGDKPGQWTANTRARVAEEVSAVKHWNFLVDPGFAPDNSTWFIDPPYQYNYRYRTGLPPFSHELLASFVKRLPRQAQIICCEAACPKTGVVPSYLPFSPSHRSVTSRRKATQQHHSRELIYYRAGLPGAAG